MSKFYLYPESLEAVGWDSGGFDDINDPFGAADDDTTKLVRTSGGSDDIVSRWNLTAFSASATTINSVTGVVRIRRASGSGGQATVGVRISGVNHFGTLTNLGSGYLNFTKLWTVNPQTAAAWTVAELNALIGSSRTTAPGASRVYNWTQMYFEVDYTGAPVPNSQALDAAARRIHAYGSPRAMAAMVSELSLVLDSRPGTLHRAEHIAGPDSLGLGWGQKPWQQRLLRVHEVSFTPGAGEGIIKYHDLRPRLCRLRDDAWTSKPANALGDGIIRFATAGAVLDFARASLSWVDDPASRLFMQLVDNQQAHNYDGLGIFGPSKNWIIQSGFQTGDITSWTKVGTGTNGSAITRDLTGGGQFLPGTVVSAEAGGMWEPDSTGVIQHFEILAGTPHIVDTYLLSTASGTITANTKLWLSWWRATGPGASPLRYTVMRTAGDYWRASDQTWVAGPIWNAMDAVAVDRTWERYTVPVQIDVGASNTAITVRVGYDAAANDGSSGRVGIICLEDGVVPSIAPILNAATALTRAGDVYRWRGDVWKNAHGGFLAEVIPQWSTADIGNTNKTVFFISTGTNDYAWLYYDGTNDRWVYERKHPGGGGTIDRAIKSMSITKGTAYKICVRHAGVNQENDDAQYTLSIWVDGVIGTDVVATAAPAEPDPATHWFEVGSKSGAEFLDGIIRLIRITTFVPTDAETVRLFHLVG